MAAFLGFLAKNAKLLITACFVIGIVVVFVNHINSYLYVLKKDGNQNILNKHLKSSEDFVLKTYSKGNLHNVPSDIKATVQSLHADSALDSESLLNMSSKTRDNNSCPKKIAVKNIKRDEIPLELYKLAPNVFKKVPSKFLNGIRSPCWKRKPDNKLLCLPSFFLAGVGKCGTTDVWYKIVQHPEIVGVEKEPRWWARGRLGRGNYRRDNKLVPLAAYFRHFEKLADLIADSDTAAKTLIAGDGSPSTYWDNILWKDFLTSACANATTPLYIISDVIRAILPQSKILTVFRNPTDRLYSDYLFENRSCTREYFHQSVVQTTRLFNSCLTKFSRRECIFNFFSRIYFDEDIPGWDIMKLYKGLYSVFIIDWLDAFPRDQLMFIRLEDWHRNCEEILPDIYRFLELSPMSRKETNNICSTKFKNPTEGKEKKGAMLEETRTLLNEFYKQSLQELATILKDDRFLWTD